MIISIEQIKAARALLKWNQKDLAARAGLNDDQIHSFESGRTHSLEVLEAIHRAFAIYGIVFTARGVEIKDETVTIFDGEGWFLRLLDDVYFTLMSTGGELLIENGDEKKSSAGVVLRIKKIREIGIKMRVLVEDGDTFLMGQPDEYRYIPKERFTNYVTLIYGDKVAVCTDGNTKAMVFKDPLLAMSRRNIFELLWDVLERPMKSTANEKY